jgi:hypothetical protein
MRLIKKMALEHYEVGYGRPPTHTRFSKGHSGNPGGRPRGITPGRATALALKELYRLVTVREAGKVLRLPAIQVVLRSQVAPRGATVQLSAHFLTQPTRSKKHLQPRRQQAKPRASKRLPLT